MIHKEVFFSDILGVDTYFLIALPDGIEEPLPAVILLRGAPEEWLNGHEDETRQGRNLLSVMIDLMHKGYAQPLAFILPCTANSSRTSFIPYAQALYPELLEDRTCIGNGQIDQFLDDEVIPRSFASGLIKKDKLSIDGFSLGGAASIYHALRRPDFFHSCGSFDGSFMQFEYDHIGLSPETPSDLRFDYFPFWFGFPPDEDIFRQVNPLDIVQQQQIQLPPTLIHYSNSNSPQANGWRVKEFLKASNCQNLAQDVTMHPASDHLWWWVDEHLYRTLPYHSHYLYQESLE